MNPEEELIKILLEEIDKSMCREMMDVWMKDIIKGEIKIINRDRKIDSFVDDKKYVEMKEEDHPYSKGNRKN